MGREWISSRGVITFPLSCTQTITDCAHIKWKFHADLMSKSLKIWRTMKKDFHLFFIFFVKSLINISDLCAWPLYWNFVELANSEISRTHTHSPPQGWGGGATPHSWTGTDAQNSSGADGIHRVQWVSAAKWAIWWVLVAVLASGPQLHFIYECMVSCKSQKNQTFLSGSRWTIFIWKWPLKPSENNGTVIV